jgi:hypothetical protein
MRKLGHIKVESTPRTALFFFTIPVLLLASMLSGIGFVLPGALFPAIGTVVWMIWFFLLFLVALPSTDTWLKNYHHRMKRGALVAFIVLLIVGIGEAVIIPAVKSGDIKTDWLGPESEEVILAMEDAFAYNDATALTHQAIDNFLTGRNPYSHPNIVKAIAKYDGSYDKVTPLRIGRFAETFPYPEPDELDLIWEIAREQPDHPPPELESKFNYPAGSFLLPALLSMVGIADLRIMYLIFIVLAAAYVTFQIPGRWRLVFIGGVLASLEIINGAVCGDTGSLVFSLILIAWVMLPRRLWVSAVFMGVAIATKQTAWFYFPFFLIYVSKQNRLWKVFTVVGIVAIIFLAMNLPFFAGDPKLMIRSILAPMLDPMFPVGVGVVTIVTGGLADIRSSVPFTILELGVMAAAIVWYFKNCRRYPHTGPILAILPLFFAWRSLWPYFFYADIIVLAGMLANEDTND